MALEIRGGGGGMEKSMEKSRSNQENFPGEQHCYLFYYRIEYLDGLAKGHTGDQQIWVISAKVDEDATDQVRTFITKMEKSQSLKIHPIEKDPLREERFVPFTR